MEFAKPFYEFYFEDTWNDKALPKKPFELKELCQKLHITLNCDFLLMMMQRLTKEIFIFFIKMITEKYLF
jgi:hypothetical protein